MEWLFQMSTAGVELSQRADAVRNRLLVLEATKTLLATQGPAVTVDAVSQQAGVGAATVVRSFGSKEALFDAALADLLEPIIQLGREATAGADADAALRRFLRELMTFQSRHRIMGEHLAELDLPATSAQRAALTQIGLELVTRASDAGAIRADIEPSTIFGALSEGTYAVARADTASGQLSDAFITIIMDGLRPGTGCSSNDREGRVDGLAQDASREEGSESCP